MLITFPASANFEHGVKEVISGERYVTSTFCVVEDWYGPDYSNWQTYSSLP